jgi:hypothetical protein
METAKKIKNILFFVSNVIKTPALIYHELCHLVMCLFTLTKVSEITIGKTETFHKDFSYDVQVYTVANSYTKNLLISIAPFFGTVIIYLLCLYTESATLLAYFVFCAKVFMPSEEDYISIDEFKSNDDLVAEMLAELGEDFDADDEFEEIDL